MEIDTLEGGDILQELEPHRCFSYYQTCHLKQSGKGKEYSGFILLLQENLGAVVSRNTQLGRQGQRMGLRTD